jgi:glycosyltransferase involved in cell wall biosynthesis
MKYKIVRITTVPISLRILLKGQLNFINNFFDVIAISSPGIDLNQVEINEKIKIKSIPMTRRINPFFDLYSLFKLTLFLYKEKPQIVHTHTPKAGFLGMISSKILRVPIRLHTVAGLPLMESHGIKKLILELVEKITYNSANMIYPNSKGLYDFILKNKYTNFDKLKIIGNGSSNGIDTNYFNPNSVKHDEILKIKCELDIKSDDFIFIYIGRIVGDKGINELIESFRRLKSNNVKLLLIGSFENDIDPLKKETLLEINSNIKIKYLGFKDDIRPYLLISNYFVFPSYREGFPNVILQAGAMGLPCIVSDINGCNEIIEEGVNGYIIPVKNVEKLSYIMNKVSSDKTHLNTLKNNSRKIIIDKYNRDYVWSEILLEYQRLIKNNNIN